MVHISHIGIIIGYASHEPYWDYDKIWFIYHIGIIVGHGSYTMLGL